MQNLISFRVVCYESSGLLRFFFGQLNFSAHYDWIEQRCFKRDLKGAWFHRMICTCRKHIYVCRYDCVTHMYEIILNFMTINFNHIFYHIHSIFTCIFHRTLLASESENDKIPEIIAKVTINLKRNNWGYLKLFWSDSHYHSVQTW